ncbi:MAG: heavy-metal-associated domain-containing protein, partial [Myxococcales bacterium]|nr:heavy-metal-associated domain-containing protein [Myxococcales bacterium]
MKTYRVEGMTCGGCVSSVTRVVQAIDDGQLDHVLWVTGDIHMTYLG